MAAQTVVITGSNGGMTSTTCQLYQAAHPEDHLILLMRKPDSVTPGLLPPESDNTTYMAFDMTSLETVRSVSKSIASKVTSGEVPKIRAIVCSAAIQVAGHPQPRVTKDGYEETVAVNHLAHFILLMELIPHLAEGGRIVIVGSDSHRPDYKYFPKSPRGEQRFTNLKDLIQVGSGEVDEPGLALANGRQRYGTSKLLQMMIGHELSRRLQKTPSYSSFEVVMLDPGSMGGTNLLRDRPYYERFVFGILLRFPSILNWMDPGLQATLKEDSAKLLKEMIEDPNWANREPAGEDKSQAPYYSPWGKLTETYGDCNDQDKCRKLWEETATLLGYSGKDALDV